MLKTVLIVLAVAVIALLAFAATRPDSFRVARSTRIAAPAETMHALIDDFRNWPRWSPYEKRDPDMKRTLGGAAKGKGATYAWDGNNNVGAGHMEILDDAPAKIVIKLDFSRPFEAHNVAEFAIVPAGGEVEVTWAMSGPAPFVSKLMGLFFSMDKMIGADFEAGLASLKAEAEKK
ncbi:MAG: SRPBCC family protein [Proteobacteria bacterium]|nr:SRPBCC family protein [Pseudomonadota bacterium]